MTTAIQTDTCEHCDETITFDRDRGLWLTGSGTNLNGVCKQAPQEYVAALNDWFASGHTPRLATAPPWTATFAAMLAASGREFEGKWHGTYEHVTVTCMGGSHDVDHGWVAPLVYAYRKCICPCHDETRPTNYEARVATQANIDQAARMVSCMISDHYQDNGRWCRWSLCKISIVESRVEGYRCPDECQASSAMPKPGTSSLTDQIDAHRRDVEWSSPLAVWGDR